MRKITIDVFHPKTGKNVRQEVLVDTKLNLDYTKTSWIALDTETLGLDFHRDPVCCVQVASPDKTRSELRVEILYTFGKNAELLSLRKLVKNPKIEKIVHVFSFDLPRIENLVQAEVRGRVWDTKIMSRIGRSNAAHHGLSALLKELCHVKKEEEGYASDWTLPYKDWSKEQIKYAVIDVLYLYEIKENLYRRVQRIGRERMLIKILDCLPAMSLVLRSGFDQTIFAHS